MNLDDFDNVECQYCKAEYDKHNDVTGIADRFEIELMLKQIPAVVAGKAMLLPLGYAICKLCGKRLNIDGQDIVVNFGGAGGLP